MNMVIAFIVTKAIVKNAPLMVLARHAMKTITWMPMAIVVALKTAPFVRLRLHAKFVMLASTKVVINVDGALIRIAPIAQMVIPA